MRQTVVAPIGLVTQPNKYGGAYAPGAMSRALNVAMRDPNIVSSMPATRSYRNDVVTSAYSIRKLFPAAASILTFANLSTSWEAKWVSSGASTAISPPAGKSFGFDTGKAHVTESRGRQLFTANAGPMILDGEGDTTARMAGLPPPAYIAVSNTHTTDAQAVPEDSAVKYRAHFERTMTVGSAPVVVVGAVSYPTRAQNYFLGSATDFSITVQWSSTHTELTAGDKLILYRTKSIPVTSFVDGDPGDTYYLASTYVLTSTDITNGQAVIRDTATDDGLGAELYTNPGQESIGGNNWMPPLADDVVTFKGYTFYAGRRLQSQVAIEVPAGWGLLFGSAERRYGIGGRSFSGDTHSNTTIDNISAANMVGLAVGQAVTGVEIPANTTITAIPGPSSITISNAATGTTVGSSCVAFDRIEIAGVVGDSYYPQGLAQQFYAQDFLCYPSAHSDELAANLGVSVLLTRYWGGSSALTLRATNGANYSPQLPEITDTAMTVEFDEKPNRYHWSKDQQPEAVPILGFAFVGAGTLYRMIGTRDAVYMFCSDGLHRLSGDGGDWRTDPVDPTLVLAARNAVDVLQDQIFAYSNRGLVSVSDAGGITEVSTGVIGDLIPGAAYADTWDTYLACDELHREAWLSFWSSNNSVSYVWNTLTKAFTTVDDTTDWTAMAYSRALRSLVIGSDAAPQNDVLYFEDDASTTRMGGMDVRLQPLYMGDPFTLKQFIGVDHLFSGVGSAMTLVPSYDGTNYTALTVPAGTLESRVMAPVPRNAPAIGTRIAPGFTLSSGGTSNNWSWRGASVTFEHAAEESVR